MQARPVRPLLVFGWGNPSRGDDALGPLLVERLGSILDAAQTVRIELLTDFQLQVEHALDLNDRDRVLFVDASRTCTAPFEITTLRPMSESGVTTHAMSPAAVMQVYRQLQAREPPECILLAIRGEDFELGSLISDAASNNLEQAIDWARRWLAAPIGERDLPPANAKALAE